MSNASANLRQFIVALGTTLGFLAAANCADAGELTVLSPQAMKPALSDLIPQFERMSGNKVSIYYSSTSALVKEIEDGKTADLAILYPNQIARLQDEGTIAGKYGHSNRKACIWAYHSKGLNKT